MAVVVARPDHVQVSQDTSGNYNLQYDVEGISRNEQRNQDGSVTGSYSYLDPNGQIHKIVYSAGVNGFVVHNPSVPQTLPITKDVNPILLSQPIQNIAPLGGGTLIPVVQYVLPY